MSKRKRFNLCYRTFLILIVGTSLFFIPGIQNDVQAGEGGAFVGGMIGGHVLTKIVDNQERQTQSMERQERQSQNQTSGSSQTQTAPAQQTVEQRLQKLDDLAQGGYITPEEYKTRRKAILDSM